MDIKEILPEADGLAQQLNCSFHLFDTGSKDWKRIFIHDHEGTTIGRLSAHFGKITNIKYYKKNYRDDLNNSDFVFLRLDRFLHDGVLITMTEYSAMIVDAIADKAIDMGKKRSWRSQNNPLKKRRKLQGRNLRHLVMEKVMNFQRG